MKIGSHGIDKVIENIVERFKYMKLMEFLEHFEDHITLSCNTFILNIVV